jgi:hypothetical protein
MAPVRGGGAGRDATSSLRQDSAVQRLSPRTMGGSTGPDRLSLSGPPASVADRYNRESFPCVYASATVRVMADDTTVSVRELRHNLAAYLARANAGERFTVTRAGRVDAELGPPTPEESDDRDD